MKKAECRRNDAFELWLEKTLESPLDCKLLRLLSRFSRVRLCATPDGSPPGSPVPGILQARTLEWVAISFSTDCKEIQQMNSKGNQS